MAKHSLEESRCHGFGPLQRPPNVGGVVDWIDHMEKGSKKMC